MTSKGPRCKLDHDTRVRRQKTLEAQKEPSRPKTHWDHVLEEMVWLSKDFESERKWKLAQARRVALRASKCMVDQATKEERKIKEEEQRLRKVSFTISKEIKKFWAKIEKLVLYKHQLEVEDKKKRALDKQLEFLLGQTERYSTMLAENLVESFSPNVVEPKRTKETISSHLGGGIENFHYKNIELLVECQPDSLDVDDDFDVHSDDESLDDERAIDEDEALITTDERQEELAALQREVDLPLEELLKSHSAKAVHGDYTVENAGDGSDAANSGRGNYTPNCTVVGGCHPLDEAHRHSMESNGGAPCLDQDLSDDDACHFRSLSESSQESGDEQMLCDLGDATDDEATLSEEEKMARAERNNTTSNELSMLQQDSEIPLEELLSRYKQEFNGGEDLEDALESLPSKELSCSFAHDDEEQEKCVDYVNDDSEPYEHSISAQVNISISQSEGQGSENRIADAAAAARSAQPTGNTFSTTKVRTKFPFLLKYPLREYQHIGLDWLVTMYEKRLNGILADEMGLGKTIMTIALLAHLACEKGIWGPHLIVVPTSVMLNWETEFLKWCPAFKILTYFGHAKERKLKRQGWQKPNCFHVCITTYRLVIQDSKVFKRKKWKYLILDEAHLIKNWKSQRWQTLLNFNSKRRVLLTGTPLQNDLMELWSLMHFLMPHVFQSHQEFKDWFCNPISVMVEGQEKVNREVVDRLHNVLRPFILRRLKRDVEKQLPMKYEHVIYCRLSRRQRNLYEDFIASSETQSTLASGNFFGMISVIMQLRKVCNHPDLFEGRPIVSSYDMDSIDLQLCSSICSISPSGPFAAVDLRELGFLFTHLDFKMTSWESVEIQKIATPPSLIMDYTSSRTIEHDVGWKPRGHSSSLGDNIFQEIRKAIWEERLREAKAQAASITWWNSLRCRRKPIYSVTLRDLMTLKHPVYDLHHGKGSAFHLMNSISKLLDIILSPVERFWKMLDLVVSFMFAIPAARSRYPAFWCSRRGDLVFLDHKFKEQCSETLLPLLSPFRPAIVRQQLYFPDRRLIQFDCGKLQELAVLLRRLKLEGHRALIFTQMTKMLDILEAFINIYGYTYMRLDGSTSPEERQTLMQRFNASPKYFLFILSTRSGGVGINLVGADTVIFYDSDWNPAMDQQAQDRCHRIGQTREVHIYRLISESTIEENILKKANQKRALDDLVIQSGGYNIEFFKKLDPMELFSGHEVLTMKNMQNDGNINMDMGTSPSNADVEAALKFAEDEADYMALKKVEEEEAVENQEFTEETIGKLEDEEFINEDDAKDDDPVDGAVTHLGRENIAMLEENDPLEGGNLIAYSKEEVGDVLPDVREMTGVAAASGHTISSFESQLRPVDHYAIRFLELWDPLIDNAALDSEITVREADWELDQIEKLKYDMEAEIDDDEEPLLYEKWDADFATEAYRQQVEALAQHQQLMEELEYEARKRDPIEENEEYTMNNLPVYRRRSKKKLKKAKFKSLKKGTLTSESKSYKVDSPEVVGGDAAEDDSFGSPDSSALRKRRKKNEFTPDTLEGFLRKKSRRLKRVADSDLPFKDYCDKEPKMSKDVMDNAEPRSLGRGRFGGKISILPMPPKKIVMIKQEKLKKKVNLWSRDCFPSPDAWLPQEDAILCAIVHEYGPQWSLASETLYGIAGGGSYRGRYRHPVHCCERFRDLIQRYVLSALENPNNEKIWNPVSAKALLKVTEGNLRTMLDVAADIPNNELLLQRHFTALLTSRWRVKSRTYTQISYSQQIARNTSAFGKSSMLLASALHDDTSNVNTTGISLSDSKKPTPPEKLELTIQFENEDSELIPVPPVLHVEVPGLNPPNEDIIKYGNELRSAEARLRVSAMALTNGSSSSGNEHRNKKQKFSAPDSIRSSKSKLKKPVTVSSTDVSEPVQEDHSHPTAEEYGNLNLLFDLDLGVMELDGMDPLPDIYAPALISDLDDLLVLEDNVDLS